MTRILFATGLIAALCGCTVKTTPVVNTVDITNTDFSKIDSMKKGESCAKYLFGVLQLSGDDTVTKAARNGDISNVKVVNDKNRRGLIMVTDCTVVFGT